MAEAANQSSKVIKSMFNDLGSGEGQEEIRSRDRCSYWERELGGVAGASVRTNLRATTTSELFTTSDLFIDLSSSSTGAATSSALVDDGRNSAADDSFENDEDDETEVNSNEDEDERDWYTFGIIDMLQRYNMRKKTEHVIKVRAMGNKRDEISSVNPVLYAERFNNFLERHTA